MKIGILTFHHVINDGSVLQAYCLQRLIESMLPEAKVELIDYRSWNWEKRELRKTIRRKFPFVRVDNWNRRKHLLNFLHRECRLSHGSCTTDNLHRGEKFIEKQGYDVIVVGSDTVWQVPNLAIKQGIPHVFYLPHINDVKKVAFAASADILDVSILDQDNNREKLRACVADFNYISYRDDSARTLLSELHIPMADCHFIADPTVLWDFSSLARPEGIDLEDKQPLAGISVAQDDVKAEATKWFRARGYQVVNFLGNVIEGQIPVPDSFYKSIAQRLYFFQHLDVLVTDRFHSSIFAMKLADAPVIFIEPSKKYQHSFSKGRDLFRRLGMEEMVWPYSPESGAKIPIDKYLQKWNGLQIHPKEAIGSLRELCKDALEHLRSEMMKV